MAGSTDGLSLAAIPDIVQAVLAEYAIEATLKISIALGKFAINWWRIDTAFGEADTLCDNTFVAETNGLYTVQDAIDYLQKNP